MHSNIDGGLMERKAVTCPQTAHLEVIDYERTSLGMLLTECSGFAPGVVCCNRECARRFDLRDRANNADLSERVLVVYAGSRRPAEAIAHALRADDLTVELADARLYGTPPPEDYDAVVLVARAHETAIAAYAREHLEGLRDRPSRVFTVPRQWSQRSLEQTAMAFAELLADDIPSACERSTRSWPIELLRPRV
jgi:hypothetical protein